MYLSLNSLIRINSLIWTLLTLKWHTGVRIIEVLLYLNWWPNTITSFGCLQKRLAIAISYYYFMEKIDKSALKRGQHFTLLEATNFGWKIADEQMLLLTQFVAWIFMTGCVKVMYNGYWVHTAIHWFLLRHSWHIKFRSSVNSVTFTLLLELLNTTQNSYFQFVICFL